MTVVTVVTTVTGDSCDSSDYCDSGDSSDYCDSGDSSDYCDNGDSSDCGDSSNSSDSSNVLMYWCTLPIFFRDITISWSLYEEASMSWVSDYVRVFGVGVIQSTSSFDHLQYANT